MEVTEMAESARDGEENPVHEEDRRGEIITEGKEKKEFDVENATAQAACCENWIVLQNVFSYLPHDSLGRVAQVNKMWRKEVELRRKVYGVNFEYEINGRGYDRNRTIANSERLFEVLEECDGVRILRLSNLRFPWPADLIAVRNAGRLGRLLPSGLPHLVHLRISKCSVPRGFEHLLDCIASIAPNLQRLNVESSSISAAEARALAKLLVRSDIRHLSAGEFADADVIIEVLTALTERREQRGRPTEAVLRVAVANLHLAEIQPLNPDEHDPDDFPVDNDNNSNDDNNPNNAEGEEEEERGEEGEEEKMGASGGIAHSPQGARRGFLEHLALLIDVPMTEEILRNFSALRHLTSLALCGFYVTGVDLAAVGSSLGSTLNYLETWLPFLDQNNLAYFVALKRLRLVLMARKDDWITVDEALPPPSPRAPVDLRDALARLPTLPPDDFRMTAWCHESIENFEVFVEIDRPHATRIDDVLDLNPLLSFVARRFGPKGVSDLCIDVGPETMRPLTDGVKQIFRNSPCLEKLSLYGGQRKYPELDISAFHEVPRSIRCLKLFGILLKDEFRWIPPEDADARIRLHSRSQTRHNIEIEVRQNGWRPGFESWHQKSWRMM